MSCNWMEVWQMVNVPKTLAHSSGVSGLFLPYHGITLGCVCVGGEVAEV